MPHRDLRFWIDYLDKVGELERIDGADWDLEIGGLTGLLCRKAGGPALLFDRIKGYPEGFRLLTCSMLTPSRVAISLGLPPDTSDKELIGMLRTRVPQWESSLDKFPPKVVKSGPVLDNVLSGKEVDLLRFPVPIWHEDDGGRYIGTGDAFITMDPDTGAVNLGAYRVMVSDARRVTFHIQPTKDGFAHMAKYHRRGKPCPVAISVGHHPLLLGIAGHKFPEGTEYRYIGAIAGEPVEVIEEEVTGLPIPAGSEMVLVGWCPPDGESGPEGPFGEFTGYYGEARRSQFIHIERVYFRDNPIILGAPPGRDPSETSLFGGLLTSVMLENRLRKSGMSGVKGVYTHRISGNFFITVSVAQQYAGHARQIGLKLASERVGGRYVVVVDDDIDVTRIDDVLWAISTRSNPERSIDILRYLPTSLLDPAVRKPADAFFTSRAVIDACRPYEWRKDFPKVVQFSPEMELKTRDKWGSTLDL